MAISVSRSVWSTTLVQTEISQQLGPPLRFYVLPKSSRNSGKTIQDGFGEFYFVSLEFKLVNQHHHFQFVEVKIGFNFYSGSLKWF